MSLPQQKRKRYGDDDSSRDNSKQRRVSAIQNSVSDQKGKSKATDPSLSSWLNIPPPPPLPEPFCTAPPVFDRDSIFIGYALPLSEPSIPTVNSYIARLPHNHPNLPDVVAGRSGKKDETNESDPKAKARAQIKPSHNMWAYKCLRKKAGTVGTSESDYEAIQASSDDGEQYGGSHLLKVLNEEGTVDVLVVCSRWFGGTMLGPIRFQHIEQSARAALEGWSQKEKLMELSREVQGLDEVIADLRAELAFKNTDQTQHAINLSKQDSPREAVQTTVPSRALKPPSYKNITNVAQLERLVRAKTLTVQTLVERVAAQGT
ncbi:hypothetical protein QFC19_008841 [Naganishia cerealis]|uniref:Uncharacterized protein n=1 Tax=Naganishia cerealis TaxID=610337 RepID=A0ACC2UZ84_9TREE|nr:hypothetical protein QFC19_008841 [Naganishia cerealis]